MGWNIRPPGMERTKPTTIWIDGKEVGANNDISTAQQYDLSSYLFPGTHTVAILVDNGKQAVPEKVYGSSHAYSASTQTNWNGIIGDFMLFIRIPGFGIKGQYTFSRPFVRVTKGYSGSHDFFRDIRIQLDVIDPAKRYAFQRICV